MGWCLWFEGGGYGCVGDGCGCAGSDGSVVGGGCTGDCCYWEQRLWLCKRLLYLGKP